MFYETQTFILLNQTNTQWSGTRWYTLDRLEWYSLVHIQPINLEKQQQYSILTAFYFVHIFCLSSHFHSNESDIKTGNMLGKASKNKQLTEACRQQVQSSGSLHWMSPRIVHLTSSVDTHSRLQCDSTFVINQHVHQHIPTASNITDNSNKKVNIYGKNIERSALNKHGFK